MSRQLKNGWMVFSVLFLFIVLMTSGQAQVIKNIVDGDTFQLMNGDYIRLLGIDTPEKGQAGYHLAKWFLFYLTEDKKIILEKGIKNEDTYGRLLRYVFLEKEKIFINELMLYFGLADFRYLSPEAKYFQQLQKAALEAEANKHGLWAFSVFQTNQMDESITKKSIISWQEASQYMNKLMTIQGKVVETYDSGRACFLNFHPDWEKTFNVVIFAEQYHHFPAHPAMLFHEKTVQVTGYIQSYQGQPEIIVKSPKQIKIIDANN